MKIENVVLTHPITQLELYTCRHFSRYLLAILFALNESCGDQLVASGEVKARQKNRNSEPEISNANSTAQAGNRSSPTTESEVPANDSIDSSEESLQTPIDSDQIITDSDTMDSDIPAPPIQNDGTPNLSLIEDHFMLANTSLSGIQFTATKGSSDLEIERQLRFKVTSSDQQLLPDENITVDCQNLGEGCTGSMSIAPSQSMHGTVTVTLEVSDGVNSMSQSFKLDVRTGPVGVADRYTIQPDEILVLNIDEDILANDIVQSPGIAKISNIKAGPGGTVTENGDGTITFVGDSGLTGGAVITYDVEDGIVGKGIAVIFITVAEPAP